MAVRRRHRALLLVVGAAVAATGLAPLGSGASAAPTEPVGPPAPAASGDVHVAMVKDQCPGSCSYVPVRVTAVGARVFYVMNHPSYGFELYVSDGTGPGTHIVKNLLPGTASSIPDNLTAVGNRLFFTALTTTSTACCPDRELFVSDGTKAGTHLVRNINKDAFGCCWSSSPSWLTDVNGTLYFSADDTSGDRELWKSDGTKAGTVRVRDINRPVPESPFTPHDSNPSNLTNVNGTLFFNAVSRKSSGTANALWKSDGSAAGTVRVKGNLNIQPDKLTAVGDKLFFTADPDSPRGRELWVSDGTGPGTHIVKDILTGTESSLASHFERGAVGDLLFFSATNNLGDNELWKSDGTKAGTQQVANLNTFSDPNFPMTYRWSTPGQFTDLNGVAYFSATAADQTAGLWRSDGTKAGTVMLPSTNTDFGNTQPAELTAVGNLVFFRGRVNASGDALWATNGTTSTQVTEGWVIDDDPTWLREAGGALFFRDWSFDHGQELWRATIEP